MLQRTTVRTSNYETCGWPEECCITQQSLHFEVAKLCRQPQGDELKQ